MHLNVNKALCNVYYKEDFDLLNENPDKFWAGAKAIGSLAFSCNKNLKEINIPQNIKMIGEKAFIQAVLEKVTIANSLEIIDESAFSNCEKLKEIILPDSLKEIRRKAFYNCISLQSIIIPPSVETIGERAFEGCKSLSSITLSNGLKKISSRAFLFCGNLKSITIPESVKIIDHCAFNWCSSLEEVVFLTNTFDSFGENVFARWNNLKKIIVKNKNINEKFIQGLLKNFNFDSFETNGDEVTFIKNNEKENDGE